MTTKARLKQKLTKTTSKMKAYKRLFRKELTITKLSKAAGEVLSR